jgi:glycine/D-amino acid oxidase-like deaminating enzyme
VGATYNWKDLTMKLSNEGKEFLIEKLKLLINSDFEVVGGMVGIRPTTPDRRPFIGQHPKNPELCIFNGFGTKGVSLAPYYARQFLEYLEKDKELDSEVNIKRYFSLI